MMSGLRVVIASGKVQDGVAYLDKGLVVKHPKADDISPFFGLPDWEN
jgi:hypothetical protein